MADAIAARAQARSTVPGETAIERARAWLPLAVTLLVFSVVSTAYNVRVPLYESPDEASHALYARIIAERGELPRFETEFEYESWHPPLYYSVGAAALKLMALDPPPVLTTNPDYPGQRNNYIHTASEDFPYTESVLAVHVLRAINTLFSMGTIIVIYLTAILLFPERKMLAFTAASTAGLIPQFAFISSMVSNDPAAVFFTSATAYCGLRLLSEERQTWLVLAALAVSLAALAKLTGLAGGAVPLGAVLLSSQDWNRKVKWLALLAIAPLVVAGWFYLRSLILWGALVPVEPSWPLQPRPLWDPAYRQIFLESIRDSFWYIGGTMNLQLSPIVHDVLDVISVLGLAGVIVSFRTATLSLFQKRGLVLLLLLPALAFLIVLYYSVTYDFTPQGRYLFAGMPAFAIMLLLGLSTIFSRADKDSPIMLTMPVLLLAVNAYIFTVILPRAY